MTEEEPLLPPPEEELQLPPRRDSAPGGKARGLPGHEVQFPTRLLDGYVDYSADPDWRAEVIPGKPKETNEQLAQMPGRPDKRWYRGAYERYEHARQAYSRLTEREKQELAEFREKRRWYLNNFMRQYTPVFKIFRAEGIRGDRPREATPLRDEKGELLRDNRGVLMQEKGDITLRIISEHSVITAIVAKKLAMFMSKQLLKEKKEREGIDPYDTSNDAELRGQAIEEVVYAAFLHDTTKASEIVFRNLTFEEQIASLEELVTKGFGSAADVEKARKDPGEALTIYEILKGNERKKHMRAESLGINGNMDTILAFAEASGNPVVARKLKELGIEDEKDVRQGIRYLDSLGEKIVNFADKLVQDTGLVENLETRHELMVQRYGGGGREWMVDLEYEYADRLAEEFAQHIPGLHSGAEVPKYIIDAILHNIQTTKIPKQDA